MPTRIYVDEKILEKALRAAEKAHGIYEKQLGYRDLKWPRWYAAFIVKQLREKRFIYKNKKI